MPTQPENKSSGLKRNPPSREITYFEKFGETVPASAGKFAANTGQGVKFGQMVREQIAKGEPVRDWQEFVKPLVEAYEARH